MTSQTATATTATAARSSAHADSVDLIQGNHGHSGCSPTPGDDAPPAAGSAPPADGISRHNLSTSSQLHLGTASSQLHLGTTSSQLHLVTRFDEASIAVAAAAGEDDGGILEEALEEYSKSCRPQAAQVGMEMEMDDKAPLAPWLTDIVVNPDLPSCSHQGLNISRTAAPFFVPAGGGPPDISFMTGWSSSLPCWHAPTETSNPIAVPSPDPVTSSFVRRGPSDPTAMARSVSPALTQAKHELWDIALAMHRNLVQQRLAFKRYACNLQVRSQIATCR